MNILLPVSRGAPLLLIRPLLRANAPTCLTFFRLAQGMGGAHTAAGVSAPLLQAIGAAAVFMGANSYIGNAPKTLRMTPVPVLTEFAGTSLFCDNIQRFMGEVGRWGRWRWGP